MRLHEVDNVSKGKSRKNLQGKQFGDWKVIGDTGLSSSSNGQAVLARNDVTNELKVIVPGQLRNGLYESTRYLKIELAYKNLKEINSHKIDGVIVSTITRKIRSDNKTGYKGITKRKNGKYRVSITVNKKRINLGTYDSLEDAINARKEAEQKYFKPILKKYNLKETN